MRLAHAKAGSVPGAGFVDPRVLARIDNLELMARTVVDGFINGLHRSPYLGLSLDFAEHRQYMPGDDIRRIDWRLFARTDRHYVKEFEADTNSNFTALLDVSKSMTYGSKGISKLDYGRYLAASLSYFSHQQRDRVGLITFDDDIVDYVPPSAKHLDVVLHTIDRISPSKPGRLGPPLLKAASTMQRRGIIALISDFYEEPEAVFDAVKHLRGRGNDLMIFHLLDPAEIDFPFDEASNFEDLESGERIPIVPETQRAQYRELIANHVSRLNRLFTDNHMDYALFDTATPLDYALFNYLSRRERLSRTR
jgi:uncharacterized protein (DUF58 family)